MAEETKELNLYYLSDNNFDCVPVLVPIKLEYNTYPFIIDAPKDMNKPKYDWTHSRWIDQTNADNQNKIADLQDAISEKDKQVTELQTGISEFKEQTQAITAAIGNLTTLVTQALQSAKGAE